MGVSPTKKHPPEKINYPMPSECAHRGAAISFDVGSKQRAAEIKLFRCFMTLPKKRATKIKPGQEKLGSEGLEKHGDFGSIELGSNEEDHPLS